MDFSSFFWLLVWAFVFACYLVVLFQIVVDLFRDENLSGWWKAVWIIFLIIVPFLSALIKACSQLASRVGSATRPTSNSWHRNPVWSAGEARPTPTICGSPSPARWD